jgi:NAD(P)H-flavin reductase
MSTAARSYVAQIAKRHDAGGGMTLISLDVPDEVRESYERPGQYTHLTLGDEGGYFVMGGREGRAPWEIVLRRGGGVADRLIDALLGVDTLVSKALGHGFPVDNARAQEVLVLVTAGAIAAARATVWRRIEDGDAKKTSLLVGARRVDTVPLAQELGAMRDAGVDVRIALSKQAKPGYERGYVQQVLERIWKPNPWIFVAGAEAMVQAVKATSTRLGAAPDHVISNV